MPRLSAIPGQPYSEANVATDRDAITYYYYNHGFPDVQFEAAASPVAGRAATHERGLHDHRGSSGSSSIV